MLKIKPSVIFGLTVILFALLFGQIVPRAVYTEDVYDALRLKYREKLTGYDPGAPYELSDPHIQGYIGRLDGTAENYWRSLNQTTHVWDDLADTSAEHSAALYSIYQRLVTMARAWATYGSEYYQNAQLLNDVVAGLDWLYENRYHEHTSPYDNWWHWQIGIPWVLNDVVVLLYDALTPGQINNYMTAIDHFTPTVDMTGANRVWKSKVVTLRGIIGKQGAKILAGSDGLNDVFSYVTSGDGFYSDGSFIQHDHYPYAGGYGADLLHHLADVLWILSGSPWDNTSSERDNVYEWVDKTFDPVLFQGAVLESVRGREISRPFTESLPEWPMGTGRTRILEGLITLTDFTDSPQSNKIGSILKHHLENSDRDILFCHLSLWAIQEAKSVLNDHAIVSAPPLVGNFQFYNQDRVVHRRPEWVYDIAMHSSRIRNYEWLNGENPRGWYTADGMTYLYLNPEDYNFIFWSTVDPHRLPGITVDRIFRPAGAACCSLMPNSWVGGATLKGTYGVAGMDFVQHDYSNPSLTLGTSMDLRVKKSWFMFDDEIVALGAGITSTSGRTIETVVENRSLNSQGDNALVVDWILQPASLARGEQLTKVKWFHLAGTGGYVFPGGADLKFLREERAGRNEDINTAFYVPGNDEFDSTGKKAFWSWVREDETRYTWTGSALRTVTQPGTLVGMTNSTRNILLAKAPPEDFRVITKLTFSPSEAGQEAGLILYRDDDNYVYISSSFDRGPRLKVVSESGGVTSTYSTRNDFGSTVYLSIDKSGNQYATFASDSGSWWAPIHTYINELAGDADPSLPLGTGGGWNPDLKMGLFAHNANDTASEIIAEFEYFHFEHTRNYLTVWMDHGVDPDDASYSFIALPGKLAQEVKEYSAHPDVIILANNSRIQAVKETKLGITGANFWSDTGGSVAGVTVYGKAAVVIGEQDETITVAVADPTHTQSTITVELARTATSVLSQDPTITVLQLSPIRIKVNVAETPGRTHTITLEVLPLDFHVFLPVISG